MSGAGGRLSEQLRVAKRLCGQLLRPLSRDARRSDASETNGHGLQRVARSEDGQCSSLHFGAIGARMAPMPSVQIKDVPDDTHAVLKRRAASAHQSLQEYLRMKLIKDASRPTVDEVLARAGGRAGGSLTLKAAARAVRNDRARH